MPIRKVHKGTNCGRTRRLAGLSFPIELEVFMFYETFSAERFFTEITTEAEARALCVGGEAQRAAGPEHPEKRRRVAELVEAECRSGD